VVKLGLVPTPYGSLSGWSLVQHQNILGKLLQMAAFIYCSSNHLGISSNLSSDFIAPISVVFVVPERLWPVEEFYMRSIVDITRQWCQISAESVWVNGHLWEIVWEHHHITADAVKISSACEWFRNNGLVQCSRRGCAKWCSLI